MGMFSFLAETTPPLIRSSMDALDEMLATTRRMFVAATDCLLEGDAPRLDLKAEDDRVNDLEADVRRALLTHFAVAPSADLALGLTLNALVQEAERMGDLAKSIAKVAALSQTRPHPDRLAPLAALRERVLGMTEDTRAALDAQDAALARSVLAANDRVKAEAATYITRLAQAPDVGANEAVVLALAARLISRYGSHLSNVASGFALPFDQLRHSL